MTHSITFHSILTIGLVKLILILTTTISNGQHLPLITDQTTQISNDPPSSMPQIDPILNKPCSFALYQPIPTLPGRIYYTPPSSDCRLKGLDAMSSWLIDWMCRMVICIFGGIALWPVHQVLFIGIYQCNRSMRMSGLIWLKFLIYSGIWMVCIGRCLCFAFDPFSYTGKLPIYISQYNNMGLVTTVFSIYSLFLLIWLRSITYPHHRRCHANTDLTSNNAVQACHSTFQRPTTHCSQMANESRYTKPHVSINNPTRRRNWLSFLTPCMPCEKDPNHQNKHALILYLRAVWGCLFVNTIMWTLELTFMFFLTQKQVAAVKSYFDLGSMGVLILAMTLIVLVVNHITVKFVECQPPPLHLDDILIVSYKPGQTSILDVTVRPQFQPLQPMPTRITRVLTGLMLISSVFRMSVGNPSMYPPGTVDIWLAVQAVILVMEASILVLVLVGLMITPDSDSVQNDPDLPLSPIQRATRQDPQNPNPLKCPLLRVLQRFKSKTPKQPVPYADVHIQPQSPPDGRPHQSIQFTQMVTNLDQTYSKHLHRSKSCSTNLREQRRIPVPDEFGNGLPPAHTFEQQFLVAHGRPVFMDLLGSSLAPYGTPEVLLPSPPNVTQYQYGTKSHRNVECTGLKNFFSALPKPPSTLIQHPNVPRTRIQVRNLHDNVCPDTGSCNNDTWDPQRPIGW